MSQYSCVGCGTINVKDDIVEVRKRHIADVVTRVEQELGKHPYIDMVVPPMYAEGSWNGKERMSVMEGHGEWGGGLSVAEPMRWDSTANRLQIDVGGLPCDALMSFDCTANHEAVIATGMDFEIPEGIHSAEVDEVGGSFDDRVSRDSNGIIEAIYSYRENDAVGILGVPKILLQLEAQLGLSILAPVGIGALSDIIEWIKKFIQAGNWGRRGMVNDLIDDIRKILNDIQGFLAGFVECNAQASAIGIGWDWSLGRGGAPQGAKSDAEGDAEERCDDEICPAMSCPQDQECEYPGGLFSTKTICSTKTLAAGGGRVALSVSVCQCNCECD